MTAVEVVATGPLALIEDLGRAGHAAVGISPSGALDRASLRAVNRVLGNVDGAAGVEILLGGAAFRARGDLIVAVAGAAGPVTVDGRPAAWAAPVVVADGQTLEFGAASLGVRFVLGVRGGIDVRRTLGSASSDLRSAIGPAALAPGAVLSIGTPLGPVTVDPLPLTIPPAGPVCLHVMLGPRDAEFQLAAVRRFLDVEWTVAPDSDRVGLRLGGPPLERRAAAEIPSEGMVTGGIQVTPDGPIVFLADHPTTGGYPVIAVLDAVDVDLVGQLRPGQRIRFVVGRATAGVRALSARLPAW